MTIGKLAEKTKLAKTLKLTKSHAMFARELEDMVGMKFPRTNSRKIEEQIIGKYNIKWDVMGAATIILGISCVIGLLKYGNNTMSPKMVLFMLGILQLVFAPGLLFSQKLRVHSIKLEEWDNDLPYGALLAVQEAKTKKFTNFVIHFPIKESSWRRHIADPVITAKSPKGSDREIFAWDDSKVYDIDGMESK